MRAPDDNGRLDAWIADPAVRTRHERSAPVDPAVLWDAARGVRLADTRHLGRLVRWRIPGLEADLTYHELLSGYPFLVLEEDDGLLISGLCGRIWTLTRDYPTLPGPEAFAAWDQPGTVRVLFGHWVRGGPGGAELVSEARVQPTDGAAARR